MRNHTGGHAEKLKEKRDSRAAGEAVIGRRPYAPGKERPGWAWRRRPRARQRSPPAGGPPRGRRTSRPRPVHGHGRVMRQGAARAVQKRWQSAAKSSCKSSGGEWCNGWCKSGGRVLQGRCKGKDGRQVFCVHRRDVVGLGGLAEHGCAGGPARRRRRPDRTTPTTRVRGCFAAGRTLEDSLHWPGSTR